MVASYSPTSSYRSGRYSGLTQVLKSLKGALVSLRATSLLQANVQTSVDTPAFTTTTQTLSQLTTLPEKSFGRQWLALIQKEGADYASFANSLHVLTGYGIDAMGKAELQAFLFGATGQVLSLVQCIESVNALKRDLSENSPLGSRLYRAYQRGRTSYFDLDNWRPEQLWDLPLQYVRQWFGLSEQKNTECAR